MKQDVLSLGILAIAAIFFSVLVASTPSPPIKTAVQPQARKSLHDCDCFTVSGPEPGYFQHYKLWDFRSVPLRAHSDPDPPESYDGDDDGSYDWDDEDADDEDADDEDADDEDADEEYDEADAKDVNDEVYNHQSEPNALWFFKTAFNRDWVSQQWQRRRTPNAPVDMVNSKRNVFFTRDRGRQDPRATYLVLRTTRHDNYTSTAEIETRVRNIYRCSIRVRLRILPGDVVVSQPSHPKEWPPRDPRQHAIPLLNNKAGFVNGTAPIEVGRPPPGACVGIFTYHALNCESDIEILTSDPSYRVRYANQPDYDPITDEMIPGASTIADLPVPWTTWSTHRLDWLSSASRWWVDNKPQEAKNYQVPNLQSRLVINLWSDGGVWTGDMRLGDSIYMGIEYIELAYNRSSDGSDRAVPPALRHGGHQGQLANASATGFEDMQAGVLEPETESVTGAMNKNGGNCKPGRKGRKCKKRKQRKGGSSCRRPCNIDDLRLGESGLRG